MKKCFIMQGIAGSGKDRWIRLNTDKLGLGPVTVVSADDFFMVQNPKKYRDGRRGEDEETVPEQSLQCS